MPELDGLAATRLLLEAPETTARVLILTTFDLDEYVYEALRAGASGFLLKDSPPEQLVAGIAVVAARRGPPRPLRHPPRDRGVRAAATRPPERAGRHSTQLTRARARGLRADRPRALERGDRRHARRQRGNRQDPRRAHPREARPARPRPGCRARLRVRSRRAGRSRIAGTSGPLRGARNPRNTTGFGTRALSDRAVRVLLAPAGCRPLGGRALGLVEDGLHVPPDRARAEVELPPYADSSVLRPEARAHPAPGRTARRARTLGIPAALSTELLDRSVLVRLSANASPRGRRS